MPDLIYLLVSLIIIALVCYLLWWALSQIPLPQPIRTVVVVLFVLVVVLYLVRQFGLLQVL
jgi:hypothetical protein